MSNETRIAGQAALSDMVVRPVSFHEALAPIREIREQVFVHEQHVPLEMEWDGLDDTADHVVAHMDGRAVGTARLLPDGRVGRMAVLGPWRNRGVGRALMEEIMRLAHARAFPVVHLDAQVHAIAFYQRFGFSVCSDVFLDAGIPHRRMRRPMV